MFVVEFRIDSPILSVALRRAPETTVTHEELYRNGDGIRFLFWASGGDLSAFEDALSADPTVTDPVVLADTGDRRLYRVTYTDAGERVETFTSWSDLDLSFLSATASSEWWSVRMLMPSRDALGRYREACDRRDLTFRLDSIYRDLDADTEGEARLTDVQREALVTARDLGYFEVPRRASLDDVAAECGVSPQAVSERLRRATGTLVDACL